MTEDKDQLHCYISPEVLRRFRTFIAGKYGHFAKGLLSYEVELALKRSMARYRREYHFQAVKEAAHTHIKITNLQKAVQLRDTAIKFLITSKRYDEPPPKVPLYMLKWAISAVQDVHDSRTVKGYLNLLESNGLIKLLDWMSKEYAIIYDSSHYSDSASQKKTKAEARANTSASASASDSTLSGHRAGPPRGVTG